MTANESATDFDIAVLGGGPVGRALALMLARLAPDPRRIVLLQRPAIAGGTQATSASAPSAGAGSGSGAGSIAGVLAAGAGSGGAAPPDPRVLAVNHGSRVLLESLHAWPAIAADIHTIHVSQRGRLGRTVIRATDFDVPRLGSVTGYAMLHEALGKPLESCGVTLRPAAGARIAGQDAAGVTVVTDAAGTAPLRCRIAVLSDGAAGDDLRRDYGQHAVLTAVRAALPRPGWAFERFTAEGPLALLPHPAAAGHYAVVWCCRPARAAQLAAMDTDEFSLAVTRAFGDRLGALSCTAARHVAPLHMSVRRTVTDGFAVAIGNAAQTLHPVAGQGLNLGLRDAARLAHSLGPWLRGAAAAREALDGFARARGADRWLTAGLTDIMPRVFATGLAPVEHAAGLALLALDLAAPLRAPLARHLLQGLRA
jgi:2-octaprenyl-6-methoxyphenol hydroxylase